MKNILIKNFSLTALKLLAVGCFTYNLVNSKLWAQDNSSHFSTSKNLILRKSNFNQNFYFQSVFSNTSNLQSRWDDSFVKFNITETFFNYYFGYHQNKLIHGGIMGINSKPITLFNIKFYFEGKSQFNKPVFFPSFYTKLGVLGGHYIHESKNIIHESYLDTHYVSQAHYFDSLAWIKLSYLFSIPYFGSSIQLWREQAYNETFNNYNFELRPGLFYKQSFKNITWLLTLYSRNSITSVNQSNLEGLFVLSGEFK